jgi:hypothetical protein
MPRTRLASRLLGAGAAALCILASPSADAARSDGREIMVWHFHIYSTLRDSRTREVARQLQVFEKTVGELIPGPDALPDVPTFVYLLDYSDFEHLAADRPGLGGFFAERPFCNVMVINGDLDFEFAKVTVLHEFTRYLQRSTQPITLPPWYVEGYAELMSSFQLKGNEVTIGGVPNGVGIDATHWIPIERVLAVQHSDPEYRAERLMRTSYGEAWSLVRLLVFDDVAHRRQTAQYLANLDAGLSEPAAFAASFPFDKTTLDADVRKLVHQRMIHVQRMIYRNPITADDAPLAHLTPAQADAAIVRMLFMIDPGRKALGELSATALRENSADLAVRALAARVAAQRAEYVEAGDLVKALRDEATASESTRIDVADTLLARRETAQANAGLAVQVLEPLVRGDGPPVEAVALWANAAALAGEPPASVIPALEAASARVPHNTMLLAGLAAANAASGNVSKARDWYTRIMLVSTSPQ